METDPVTVCVDSAQFNQYQPYLFTSDVCNRFPDAGQELVGGCFFYRAPPNHFLLDMKGTLEQKRFINVNNWMLWMLKLYCSQ